MRVPIDWLREYCSFDITAEELASRLTMAGLEVEDIEETEGQKVFSTYVTPDRSDLLSMVGVAREVSALLASDFREPKPAVQEGTPKASDLVSVDIRSQRNCPRYSARVILDTKVVDSPAWMQKCLVAAGMRPINNIVDATNYVLLELGQPLHAFDYDLVTDHKIIVRQAEPGEKMTTIDGQERELTPDMLVIADPKGAVAVAGVMGGFNSEVSSSTRNVLLESAHFNRLSIRRTARALQMSTEASFRFERWVDPSITICALDRVAQLIQQTGGYAVAVGVVDEYPATIEPARLTIRPQRASMVLGFEVSAEQIIDSLTRLGMDVENDGELKVKVPTFRPDIQREEDLIEEVGRIYGYDAIPETPICGETTQGRDSREGEFTSKVADILVSAGLQEVVTGSMTAPVEGETQAAIRNPMSDDLSKLRKQLILDLLSVIAYNVSRGTRDVGIFEIGRVFEPQDESILVEKLSIGAALTGSMWARVWNVDRSSLQVDFFICKGIVEDLLNRLNVRDVIFKPTELEFFHPTRAAVIEASGTPIGVIGEISSEWTRRADISDRTYAFELDFEELMEKSGGPAVYKPISRYPAVARDLAIVVADEVPYRRVVEVLNEGSGALLEGITLFDLYSGPPLLSGQKSLAFKIVFRSHERTLRDEEVDELLAHIRSLLASELGASFRDT